jgi:hypothetical protein
MTKARTLADNYAADINQITASAPLTGGGTSGTVTVGIQAGTTAQSGAVQLTDSTASTSITTAATPNSVKSAYDLANGAIAKSLVDAKGDLLVGSANDTVSRLAVASTAGYVLTVDSAEATGLKWAAGGTAFSGCRVYSNVDPYNITNDSPTAVDFDSEVYDVGGYHSVSSNTSRFTIPSGKAGYYLVQGQVSWIHNTSGKRQIDIYKNGTGYASAIFGPSVASSPGDWPACPISIVINLSVGDYVTMVVTQKSGGTIKMINGSDTWTWFQITYLGA